MKEVRKCERCEKWKKRQDTEEVSIGSYYKTRYSSIEGHSVHTKVDMCAACIKEIFGE